MKYQYWMQENGQVVVHYSDTVPQTYYRLFELCPDGNYWEVFL